MNFDRPHQPCCDRHNTCQACGESWPCQDELARQLAALGDRLARMRRRTRLPVLTATTEGSTR